MHFNRLHSKDGFEGTAVGFSVGERDLAMEKSWSQRLHQFMRARMLVDFFCWYLLQFKPYWTLSKVKDISLRKATIIIVSSSQDQRDLPDMSGPVEEECIGRVLIDE